MKIIIIGSMGQIPTGSKVSMWCNGEIKKKKKFSVEPWKEKTNVFDLIYHCDM